MPIVEAITISRGEEVTLHMTETPNKDLTGWVISMTVSRTPDKTVKMFQITAILTDAPNSKYDIIIPQNYSNQVPGTYYYDIWRVNPGFNRIMREGEFIITANSKFPT